MPCVKDGSLFNIHVWSNSLRLLLSIIFPAVAPSVIATATEAAATWEAPGAGGGAFIHCDHGSKECITTWHTTAEHDTAVCEAKGCRLVSLLCYFLPREVHPAVSCSHCNIGTANRGRQTCGVEPAPPPNSNMVAHSFECSCSASAIRRKSYTVTSWWIRTHQPIRTSQDVTLGINSSGDFLAFIIFLERLKVHNWKISNRKICNELRFRSKVILSAVS